MTYNLRRLLSGMKEAFARNVRRNLKAKNFHAMDEQQDLYQECSIEELHVRQEDDIARRSGL